VSVFHDDMLPFLKDTPRLVGVGVGGRATEKAYHGKFAFIDYFFVQVDARSFFSVLVNIGLHYIHGKYS
jgi:hypothetical protein